MNPIHVPRRQLPERKDHTGLLFFAAIVGVVTLIAGARIYAWDNASASAAAPISAQTQTAPVTR